VRTRTNKNTLIEIADKVNSTPQEVWRILMGSTTDDFNLANAISTELNLSATNLLFKTTKNLRPGTLDWVATYLCVAKNTVWRFVHGHKVPGKATQKKLANFAKLDVDAWRLENVGKNWLLSDRGIKNTKNRDVRKNIHSLEQS